MFEKVFKIAKQNVQINYVSDEEIDRDPHVHNVIVIGPINSGKTTLVEVLKDVCHLEKSRKTGINSEVSTLKLHHDTFNFLEIQTCDSVNIAEKISAKAEEIFQGILNVESVILTINYQGLSGNHITSINNFFHELPASIKKIMVRVGTERNANRNYKASFIRDATSHSEMSVLMNAHFSNEKNIQFSGSLQETDCGDDSKEDTPYFLTRILDNTQEIFEVLLPGTYGEKKDVLQLRLTQQKEKIDTFLKGLGIEEQPQEKKDFSALGDLW